MHVKVRGLYTFNLNLPLYLESSKSTSIPSTSIVWVTVSPSPSSLSPIIQLQFFSRNIIYILCNYFCACAKTITIWPQQRLITILFSASFQHFFPTSTSRLSIQTSLHSTSGVAMATPLFNCPYCEKCYGHRSSLSRHVKDACHHHHQDKENTEVTKNLSFWCEEKHCDRG